MTKENYKNLYDSLIQHRKCFKIITNKSDPKYIYHERHHIVPKSIGGSDNEENIVNLYGYEHFIAHKLLMYIYADTSQKVKMAAAFWRMCYCKRDHKYHLDKTSKEFHKERQFAMKILIEKISNKIRINNGIQMKYIKKEDLLNYLNKGFVIGGLPLKEETKNKISRSNTGRPNKYRNCKLNADIKHKMSLSHLGKPSKTKNRIYITDGIHERRIYKNEDIPNGWKVGRKQSFGKNPWNKGIKQGPLTKKQKENISKNSLNRRHYTNGIKNIFVYPGTEPIGFYPGQTNKKKNN